MPEPADEVTDPDGSGIDPAAQAQVSRDLRSSNADRFQAAVETAVRLGAAGDALLADLDQLSGWRQLLVVASLGDVRGPKGEAALLRALSAHGPGTSDLRCAAVLALAKRNEPSVDDVLPGLLDDRDAAVRQYALLGLARAGDGSGYDAVLDRLKALTSRKRKDPSHGFDISPVITATTYLLRHAAGDARRLAELAAVLRLARTRLSATEQAWLDEHWAELRSGDGDPTDVPDVDALQESIAQHPLFQPL